MRAINTALRGAIFFTLTPSFNTSSDILYELLSFETVQHPMITHSLCRQSHWQEYSSDIEKKEKIPLG